MVQNPERYRYQSTEHFRDTIDTLNIRLRSTVTGSVYFNRTYNNSDEQYYYSPDHFSRDTVGFRSRDNPFYVNHEHTVPPFVSYVAEHERVLDPILNPDDRHKTKRTYEGWGPTSHNLHPTEADESDEEYMTRAIAGVNPSRANASGAVFIAELRELPSLFKNLGEQMASKGFLSGSSSTHLGIQFGWAPVIRDLKKFLSITDKVRNRVLELQELRGTGKLRREFREKDGRGTQVKHSFSRISNPHTIGVLPSGGDDIWFDVHTEMRTTRWAIIEFINDSPETLFSPSDGKYWDEAHSLVYGTNIDGPSLWQAMPWSWLIGWVSNMNDYVKSQSNVAGHKLGQTMLMKETVRITTITPVMDDYPGYNGQWSWTFLPGRVETVTKERILDVQPTVNYTVDLEPILGSEFKSSILSALFVQKAFSKIRFPKI